MKLLLDQGLPRSAGEFLRAAGHDAVHVGEIGLATAEDRVILDRGRSEGRVVVTLDADFHALLAVSAAVKPSVVRVRISALKGDALARLLLAVLEICAADLEAGAAVSVLPDRVRLRRLPLSERTSDD